MRGVGFAALLGAMSVAACDLLLVEPPATGREVDVQLALLSADEGDTAVIVDAVERVEIKLTRPDGSHREVALHLERVNPGEGRMRMRLEPRELAAPLGVDVALMAGQFTLYRGSGMLDPGAGVSPTLRVSLTAEVGGYDAGPPLKFDAIGETRRTPAAVRFINGDPIPDLISAWSSSNPQVAEVTNNRWVTSRRNGSSRLWATWEGHSDGTRVEVRQIAVQVGGISSVPGVLPVGASTQLQAIGRDRVGTPLQPGAEAGWHVRAGANRLAINRHGVILGLEPGEAEVAAGPTTSPTSSVVWVVAPLPSATPTLAWGGVVGHLSGEYRDLSQGWGGGQPTLAPGRDALAFVSRGRLYGSDLHGNAGALDTRGLTVSWPEYTADGSWIMFGAVEAGKGSSVYRIRPNGSGMELLVDNATQPTSSPDGLRIAFVRGGDLVVQELNGASRVVAGGGVQTPAWSPDGEWIAFVNGSGQVFLAGPDGSETLRFKAHLLQAGFTWSPDGAWILGFGQYTTIGDVAAAVAGDANDMWRLPWAGDGGAAWWR